MMKEALTMIGLEAGNAARDGRLEVFKGAGRFGAQADL